jgi:hypothetical protein
MPYLTRSLPAQFWHWCTEWSNVWVSTKLWIAEEIWPGQGLNPGLPNDTSALYPLLHELMLIDWKPHRTMFAPKMCFCLPNRFLSFDGLAEINKWNTFGTFYFLIKNFFFSFRVLCVFAEKISRRKNGFLSCKKRRRSAPAASRTGRPDWDVFRLLGIFFTLGSFFKFWATFFW